MQHESQASPSNAVECGATTLTTSTMHPTESMPPVLVTGGGAGSSFARRPCGSTSGSSGAGGGLHRTLSAGCKAVDMIASGIFAATAGPSAMTTVSAKRALQRCINSTTKPPLPSNIALLVDVSRKQNGQTTISESVRGQNNWLVSQLHKLLQKAQEQHVVVKIMMVVHDLLVYGASEFAAALAPVAESFFDPDSLLVIIKQAEEARGQTQTNSPYGDASAYEQATRYFIAYVHALLQFQLRHDRSEGNLLDPSAMDMLLRLNAEEEVNGNQLRDVIISCVTLTKFLLAANAAMPCFCLVFAEVSRRYVADSKRLYHVVSRTLHISIIGKRRCSATPIEEIRKNMQCMKHYVRLTDQLNDFYDSLRALPEGSFYEKELIPVRLRQLPSNIQTMMAERLQRLEDVERISVDTLQSVLSKNSDLTTPLSPPSALTSSSVDPTPQLLDDTTRHQLSAAATPALQVDHVRAAAAKPASGATRILDDSSFDTAQSFFLEGLAVGAGDNDIVMNNRAIDASRFDDHQDNDDTASTDGASDAAGEVLSGDYQHHQQLLQQLWNPSKQQQQGTKGRSPSTNTQTSESITDPSSPRDPLVTGTAMPNHSMAASEDSGLVPSSVMITAAGNTTTDLTRFTVLDQVLGKGGFGVVLKAWDEEEGRHVACKEVKMSENKAATQELLQEYRVLTTLQHPNIVRVIGFVVHKGSGRIFMEWVPSGSVQAVLQETNKGMREGVVRRYLREALEGLAYLHSRGIVHRDMKPGNMLLSADGTVKLTDFGTSRALEHGGATMQTGTVVGTVPYLAPECVRGTYSAASDVWAVGCTALHMITGRAPWADEARDHVALIFKIGTLSEAAHLPKSLSSCDMSCELRSFISAAMSFDRHARPSAEELLSHPMFAL